MYTTNLNQLILYVIMFFVEIPRRLKISIFLQTALATYTHLALGLTLAQCRASNTERSVIVLLDT